MNRNVSLLWREPDLSLRQPAVQKDGDEPTSSKPEADACADFDQKRRAFLHAFGRQVAREILSEAMRHQAATKDLVK
jgi:hypothetical protein